MLLHSSTHNTGYVSYSRHFRSIRNFHFSETIFTKWPVAILDAQFGPISIGTSRYSRSVATSNMKLIGAFLIKLWSVQACSSYLHILVFRYSPKSLGSSTLGHQWLSQI